MRIQLVLDGMFLSILAVCTITDLKKRIIPNSAVACLFLLGLLNVVLIAISGISIFPYPIAVIVMLPSLVAWRNGKIGGGDIKLLLGMGLYLGIWRMTVVCIGMILPCLGYLLYLAIRKARPVRVPLAPFMLVGSTLSIVISVFLYI